MSSGDILSLASSGSYTLDPGEAGFENLLSGESGRRTTIRGNGATITGGNTGVDLTSKSYFDFENLNWRDQTSVIIEITTCNNFIFSNCTFGSTANPGALTDVVKIRDCDDFEFTDCEQVETSGGNTCDGFEVWGPSNRGTFTRCIAHDITGGISPAHHGFEAYGESPSEICDDIQWIDCEAYNLDVGFSCEGGAGSDALHTNVVADGCSGHDNNNYGYQGIQGATLFRENVASGNNTGNGVSETNGNVTDLS